MHAVLLHVPIKFSSPTSVSLEDVLGANTPLFNARLLLINRGDTLVSYSIYRRWTFSSQNLIEFNGDYSQPIVETSTLSEDDHAEFLAELGDLLSPSVGVSTVLDLAPLAEATALVSLIIRGEIDSKAGYTVEGM